MLASASLNSSVPRISGAAAVSFVERANRVLLLVAGVVAGTPSAAAQETSQPPMLRDVDCVHRSQGHGAYVWKELREPDCA
jgi:hypothetical protein